MKDIMKFKLMFVLMIVSNFCCDVIQASDASLLQPGTPDYLRNEIKNMRDIAASAHRQYIDTLNITSLTKNGKGERIERIASNLTVETGAFLKNSENTDKILKLRRDDCLCFTCPRLICCIPLLCLDYCTPCSYWDMTAYQRAQFNVLKAIAFVEQDIKR